MLVMLNAAFYCLLVGFYNINTVHSSRGKDNKGTEFIFSFMDNDDIPSLEIFITTDSPGVTYVNVSTPRYNEHILHTFSLTKGQVKAIPLPSDIRGIGTEIGNKGVQILSTAEVAVFAVNKHQFTTDAYVVFPTDTLGRKYYVISWSEASLFMIVATKDKTTVNITLIGATILYNGLAYTSGMTLSIYLQKWQTFHAYNETAGFTGTLITSDNEIAVLSGNRCVNIGEGACDHTVSQMTPVETFGHDFVAISMPNCSSSVSYIIISSEDNTNIIISGMPAVQLSTAGNFHTFDIQAKSSKVISANKPIAMALFAHGACDSKGSGDPAMILMPPVPQFAADYTFATIEVPNNSFQNVLTIVIRGIHITGLVLDGQNISSFNWSNVEGSDILKVNELSVNDGSHTVYHVDPTVTFLAVSTGLAKYNSYGYVAGQRLASINSICTESITTPGDIIDNDCDGLIDEEIQDGKDEDGDGRIDEDLAAFFGDVITLSTSTQVASTEGSTTYIFSDVTTSTSTHVASSEEIGTTFIFGDVTTSSTAIQCKCSKDVPDITLTIQATLFIAGITGLAAAALCCIPFLLFIWRKKRSKNRVHSRRKPARKPDMSCNRF